MICVSGLVSIRLSFHLECSRFYRAQLFDHLHMCEMVFVADVILETAVRSEEAGPSNATSISRRFPRVTSIIVHTIGKIRNHHLATMVT